MWWPELAQVEYGGEELKRIRYDSVDLIQHEGLLVGGNGSVLSEAYQLLKSAEGEAAVVQDRAGTWL